MNQHLSNAQLKDSAKDRLAGRYGFLIGVSLFTNAISMTASGILSFFTSEGIAGFIVTECITLILSVFLSVFTVGVTYIYLKLSCGMPADFRDLFFGFGKDRINRSLAVALVMTLFAEIPLLLAFVPRLLYLQTGELMYEFLFLGAYAVGGLIYLILYLNYSQCYYLMLDFPQKKAKDILFLAPSVMNGHKMRLFLLYLSFLPMILLSIISIIGVLWVVPYIQMTMAKFYFDLMKSGQKQA